MAFLTNLGVSNGGYPAIRLETATFTRNGTYTAPRGVAYSQVNVNVPSTGITDVDVLPDVSSFNEGDIVHLMQDDIRRTPVHLYALKCVDPETEPGDKQEIWLFSRRPNLESIDDLVVVQDYRVSKLVDAYNVSPIIQGTEVYITWGDSTTETYRRDETNDLVGISLLHYVDANGEGVYVTDDTQGDLKSRIYELPNTTGLLGFISIADYIDTVSIVDETLSITFKDGDEFIANRDTSGDRRIDDVSCNCQGYYKVENGIWVRFGAPTVEFTVERDRSSKHMYIHPEFEGLMVRKRNGNGWTYRVHMGRYGWCDINGNSSGFPDSWIDSAIEVGYGIRLYNNAKYEYEVAAFVRCPCIDIN